YLGVGVSLLSVLMVLFTLAQRIFIEHFARWGLAPVPGFATIVVSIFFLGGVQLMCLGILGEYLGRIYEDVKRRPMWTFPTALGVEDPLLASSGHLDLDVTIASPSEPGGRIVTATDPSPRPLP